MAPLRLNIQITAAKGVGGVYPFAVACFDGDISHELYKSKAATTQQDGTAIWNESFNIDLTNEMKTYEADNRPLPKYLTLFLFDTGSHGVPSLGSAGILLSNVHEKGRSAGDFPVVNGTGSLALVAELEKADKGGFFHSDAAKITGAVAGAGAAVGLGAFAFNKYKQRKKKRAGEGEEGEEQQQDQYVEENRQEQQQEQQANRPWYDPETSSDEDDETAVLAGQTGDTYAQQTHAPVSAYHAPQAAYASGVHGTEGEDDEDDDDE